MALFTTVLFSLFPTIVFSSGLIVGHSVVEVTQSFNDVFPYENFNRNVTVPMWDTSLLNGKNMSAAQKDLETIANASFIVYDSAFYNVRL